jgi:2C-methyl-D-erythritol 2,4-cyclodiphosphate synthase
MGILDAPSQSLKKLAISLGITTTGMTQDQLAAAIASLTTSRSVVTAANLAAIPAKLDSIRPGRPQHSTIGIFATDLSTSRTYRVDAEPPYGTAGTSLNYTLTPFSQTGDATVAAALIPQMNQALSDNAALGVQLTASLLNVSAAAGAKADALLAAAAKSDALLAAAAKGDAQTAAGFLPTLQATTSATQQQGLDLEQAEAARADRFNLIAGQLEYQRQQVLLAANNAQAGIAASLSSALGSIAANTPATYAQIVADLDVGETLRNAQVSRQLTTINFAATSVDQARLAALAQISTAATAAAASLASGNSLVQSPADFYRLDLNRY